MNRTRSLFALSLLLATGAALAAGPQTTSQAAAPAATKMDGMKMDGMKMDGMKMDGMKMDGMKMDGMKMDGMKMDGMKMDGMKMDGMKMDGTDRKAAFARLDKNADGRIARDELPNGAPLAKHFAMLDTDRDGSLTLAEYAKLSGM